MLAKRCEHNNIGGYFSVGVITEPHVSAQTAKVLHLSVNNLSIPPQLFSPPLNSTHSLKSGSIPDAARQKQENMASITHVSGEMAAPSIITS